MSKQTLTCHLAGLLLALWISAPAMAQSTDEQLAEKYIHDVNQEAETQNNAPAIISKLEEQFHVSERRISHLRDKNLGYGEIKILLTLAQRMPGGINDRNINKVMIMRYGPDKMGWGVIAKRLGFNLGSALKQANDLPANTPRNAETTKSSAVSTGSNAHSSKAQQTAVTRNTGAGAPGRSSSAGHGKK